MSGTNAAAGVIDGVTTIEAGTPLTRLHYFDGKFLQADALTLEQDYQRELVRLSNLAGGWGVVHGLGIGLVDAQLSVSPGLAITPTGRIVLLGTAIQADIAALIAEAAAAPAAAGNAGFGDCAPATTSPTTLTPGQGICEITVAPVQALCGNEEVFGKLCEDACVTDSQRPYWREGMILRLRAVSLTLPVSTAVTLGLTHLRNRVASAYFAHEPWLTKPLLSAAGLTSTVWCQPALLYTREEVPIGLLVREGSITRVLDAWSARRERMETQARGYWQGRMRMRPWNVFLAQILQFQCQLSGLFKDGSPAFTPNPDDECAMLRQVLDDSISQLEAARQSYALGDQQIRAFLGASPDPKASEALGTLVRPLQHITALAQRLGQVKGTLSPLTPNRLLLNGGFVELPPAGYLPVIPGQSPVNLQLQKMFGEGVTLKLCAAPVDHLAHLLEEAQHMDRISLTRGLDDPTAKEPVEVFVPDGVILGSAQAAGGVQWIVGLDGALVPDFFGQRVQSEGARGLTGLRDFVRQGLTLVGVGRSVTAGTEGGAISMVMVPEKTVAGLEIAAWSSLQIDRDPFAAAEGDELPAALEERYATIQTTAAGTKTSGGIGVADGRFVVGSHFTAGPGEMSVMGRLNLIANLTTFGDNAGQQTASTSLDLTLTRAGTAAAGSLRIDVRMVSTGSASGRWQVNWSGTPRHAVVETVTNQTATKAADLTETPALTPENPARLKALGALDQIAQATNDPGFTASAKRKLFADAAVAPDALLLRAVRDWVLFRRRRQVVCTMPEPPTPVSVTESFQVFHTQVTDAEEVKGLVTALDSNNPTELARFKFARVDVLHYVDDGLMPSETVASIVSDWRTANPSRTVEVARVWEHTHDATHDARNRTRLQLLIQTLEDQNLLDPPLAGVIEAMTAPPASTTLDDPGFGGGILLATLALTVAHRVFLVNVDGIEIARRGVTVPLPPGVATLTLSALGNLAQAHSPLTIHFPGGGATPLAADMEALKTALAGGAFITNVAPLALVAPQGSANQAVRNQAAILHGFGAQPATATNSVSFADFGDGALEATVVAIRPA